MPSAATELTALDRLFAQCVSALESVLFYPIPLPDSEQGIPFLVLWLLIGGIFFTLRLGFANIRLMGHGLRVIAGKYKHEEGEGEISSFQAVATVVSGTVGVGGNIAGVAIAVSLGGPGAVVWIMLAGILCTANKFAEVIVGHRYRHKDHHGKFNGGAWYYLTDGLREAGYGNLGKPLAVFFAICCVAGALGGGNMFQSNQAVAIVADTYPAYAQYSWIIALLMAILIGVVLIGGIRRIARVTEIMVPAMALTYVAGAMVVLFYHIQDIPAAFATMFHEAFTLDAAGGGMIGALIMGLRRAFFSNEAGVGSAPIAHAASRNIHPVREGAVALIEPIIDSVIICTLTGLVIIITGAYLNVDGISGVALTNQAFASVISWFPHILTVVVLLFAFSTALTWSYYAERAWNYLTGERYVKVYYLLFCTLTLVGGFTQLGPLVTLSDLMLLSMAIPNLIGLYLMSGMISRQVKDYRTSLKPKT